MPLLESTIGLKEFEKVISLVHKGKYKDALDLCGQVRQMEGLDRALATNVTLYAGICSRMLLPLPPEPKSAGDMVDRVVYHLNRNELDQAEERIQRARKMKADAGTLHYLEAVLHCKRNNPGQALKALGQAVEKDPGNRLRAHGESDFDPIRHMEEFKRLVSS